MLSGVGRVLISVEALATVSPSAMIGRGVTGITLIMVPNDSDLFTRLLSFTFPGTDKERFIWLCNCGFCDQPKTCSMLQVY